MKAVLDDGLRALPDLTGFLAGERVLTLLARDRLGRLVGEELGFGRGIS